MTGSASEAEMTAEAVGGFLSLMETQRHGDLDIVIEERHVPIAVATLPQRGYAPVPRIPIPADYVRFDARSP
jgi:hypothetical protein